MMANDVEKLIAEIIFVAKTGDIDTVAKKLNQLKKETAESDSKLSVAQKKQIKELQEFVKTEQQAATRVEELNKKLVEQQKVGGGNVDQLKRELDVARKYQDNLKSINKTRLEAISPKSKKPIERKITPTIDRKALLKDIGEVDAELEDLEEILNLDRVLFPRGLTKSHHDIDGFIGDLKDVETTQKELKKQWADSDFESKFGVVRDLKPSVFDTSADQYGKDLSMEEYEKRYGKAYSQPHSVFDDRVTPEDWERPKWTRERAERELGRQQQKLYTMEGYLSIGKQKKERVDAKRELVQYLEKVVEDFDDPGSLDKWMKSNFERKRIHVDQSVLDSPKYKKQQATKLRQRSLMSKVKSAEARDYKKEHNLDSIWDVARPKLETRAAEAFAMANAQEKGIQDAIQAAMFEALDDAIVGSGEPGSIEEGMIPWARGKRSKPREKTPAVEEALKGGNIEKAVEDIDRVIDDTLADVIMEGIDDVVKEVRDEYVGGSRKTRGKFIDRKRTGSRQSRARKLVKELVSGDDDKQGGDVKEIAEDLGKLDVSPKAIGDIGAYVDDQQFDYQSELPLRGSAAKLARIPERPEQREKNQQQMLKDFGELEKDAKQAWLKAKHRQRIGKGSHYAVQKAGYRLDNIRNALADIAAGKEVFIDDAFVSPYAYTSDILDEAQFPYESKNKEKQRKKERIERLPEDLQFMAAQKKVNISQAEDIASNRMVMHSEKFNAELRQKQGGGEPTEFKDVMKQKVQDIFGSVRSSLMGALSEQKVTMTGEFDTEDDMEAWINKLMEFGGVTKVQRREKDVKYQTEEGPHTQRRHVGTVTMTKSQEDLMLQKDALKQVNQSVMDQGKAYSTTNKVASRYTGNVMSGFARIGQQFKTLSWQFTMLSMGSLGVFFSMMSFATLLRSAFGAILGPIMNLEQAFQTLGMAVGLEDLSAVSLQGESPAEQILGNPEGLVEAWATMQYIVGNLVAALIGLGIELLTDEEFVANLETAFNAMMEVLQSDEVVDSIKSLANSFVELLPSLVELIPWVAEFFQILTINLPLIGPLLPFLVKLALVAAVLMPIFSVLSMTASIVGVVFNALSAIGTYLLIPALEALAAALGITVGTLSAIIVVIAAVIAVVAIILDYFGYLDDAVNILITVFQTFLGVLTLVFDTIASIAHELSKIPFIGDVFAHGANLNKGVANFTRGGMNWLEDLKWQDRDTGETPFAVAGAGTKRTDVTVNQTIYGTSDPQKTADLAADKMVDGINTAIH